MFSDCTLFKCRDKFFGNRFFLDYDRCLLEDPTTCKLLNMLLFDKLADFFVHNWLLYFMDHIYMLFMNHRLMNLVDNFLVNDRLDIFINYWLDILVNNILMILMNHRLMSLIYHFLMVLLDDRWKDLGIKDRLFLMTFNNGFFDLHFHWQPCFLVSNHLLLFDFPNDRWLILCL